MERATRGDPPGATGCGAARAQGGGGTLAHYESAKERVEESKQQLEDEPLTTSDVMRNAARHHRELRAHVDANLAPSLQSLQSEVTALRHQLQIPRARGGELEEEKVHLMNQKREERQPKERVKQEAVNASKQVELLESQLLAAPSARTSLQSTHATLLASSEHLRTHTSALEVQHHALEASWVKSQEGLKQLESADQGRVKEWQEKLDRLEGELQTKQSEVEKERSKNEQGLQREDALAGTK